MSKTPTLRDATLQNLHRLDQLVRTCSDRISELTDSDMELLDINLALSSACRSIEPVLKEAKSL